MHWTLRKNPHSGNFCHCRIRTWRAIFWPATGRKTRCSRVSSTAFVAELRTDAACRRIVFWSGAALVAAGACLLLATPIDVRIRILLLVIWLLDGAWSLYRLARGWQSVRGIRLSSTGEVFLLGSGGTPVSARVTTGSVVGRRLAWLRLLRPDGFPHAELLLAKNAESLAWHRFQLIWRIRREAFGHRGPA